MTTLRRPHRWKTNEVLHCDFTPSLECMEAPKPKVIIILKCGRLTVSTVFVRGSTCSLNDEIYLKADIIYAQDAPREMEEVRQLLGANKLALDPGVELFVPCRYQGRLIACAGLEHKTVKCVAIDEKWRGESLGLGLANKIRRLAAERRAFHLFLYSAPDTLEFFRGWDFYPLVEAPQLVILMESSPVTIKAYCAKLRQQHRPGKKIGARS